jgi:hypothetical protein
MKRVLLIETGSPKRIREKAEQLLKSEVYPNPEISILCQEKNTHFYSELPGVRLYALADHSNSHIARELARNRFDAVFEFWTGEKQYRRWKLLSLRLKAKERYILAGDGNEFRLTWKAICRHSIFRFQHPLPTDHHDYVDEQTSRENILVLQTAEPRYVLGAMERLREYRPFKNPHFTIFCRNWPEIADSFRGNPLLDQVLTHSETRGSWKYLRFLRRQRFDGIVIFLTGDPSYRKMKLFAFLLGTRRVLVFNESNDCFFFNLRQWFALLSRRMHEWEPQKSEMPQWDHPKREIPRRDPKSAIRGWDYSKTIWRLRYWLRVLLPLIIKSVSLPFRFLWLLLIWLRLRIAGLIWSRNSHDYSL